MGYKLADTTKTNNAKSFLEEFSTGVLRARPFSIF